MGYNRSTHSCQHGQCVSKQFSTSWQRSTLRHSHKAHNKEDVSCHAQASLQCTYTADPTHQQLTAYDTTSTQNTLTKLNMQVLLPALTPPDTTTQQHSV